MSPSGDSRKAAASGSIIMRENALRSANEIWGPQLQKELQRNPSVDMVPLLEHVIRSYNRQKKMVMEEQVLSSNGKCLEQENSTESSNPPLTNKEQEFYDIRHQIMISEDVSGIQILHPFDKALLNELQTAASSISGDVSALSNVHLKGLNRLIEESSIIWELVGLTVLRLTPNLAVKIGHDLDTEHFVMLDEIEKFAPKVPKPKVFGVLKASSLIYSFMSLIEGQPLNTIWPKLTNQQKCSIRDQLGLIFSQIRSVPWQRDEEGKLTLGSGIPRRCKDTRQSTRVADYAIDSEDAFNDFLTFTPGPHRDQEAPTTNKMIRSFLRLTHDIVFTHGDLHPRNVMVVQKQDSNGEGSFNLLITGILDWDRCGWYPAYWEYVKALYTTNSGSSDGLDDWWEYLPTEIGSWGGEYAVDLMLSRWLRY
jgi:hypothetical protein